MREIEERAVGWSVGEGEAVDDIDDDEMRSEMRIECLSVTYEYHSRLVPL
jgi:hypothetical protein